jgi:hypothetical protein
VDTSACFTCAGVACGCHCRYSAATPAASAAALLRERRRGEGVVTAREAC